MIDLSCTTCVNYKGVLEMYNTNPCMGCHYQNEYKDTLDVAMDIPLDVDPGRKVNTTLKEDKDFNRECRQLSTPRCYGDYWNQGDECIMCESALTCITAWNRRSKHA